MFTLGKQKGKGRLNASSCLGMRDYLLELGETEIPAGDYIWRHWRSRVVYATALQNAVHKVCAPQPGTR